MGRFLKNYLERHRHPVDQALHVVGVPLCFVAAPILLAVGWLWWALASFVGGYVFQFLGHAIEGNDAGEVILVKRLLALPYTEFAPERVPRER